MIFFAEKRTELPDGMFSRQQNNHWKKFPSKIEPKKEEGVKLSKKEIEKRSERRELMESTGFRKQLETAAKLLHMLEVEKKPVYAYSEIRKEWKEMMEKASTSEVYDLRDSIDERRERLLKSSQEREVLFRKYSWLRKLGKIRRGKWQDPNKNPKTWWGKQNLKKEEEIMKAKGTPVDKLVGGEKAVTLKGKEKAPAKTKKVESKFHYQRLTPNNGLLEKLIDVAHSKITYRLIDPKEAKEVLSKTNPKVVEGKVPFGKHVMEVPKVGLFSVKIEKTDGPRGA